MRNKLKAVLSSKSSNVKLLQWFKSSTSVESVYLYLTHESKDAIKKAKYRYNKADIKHINNFDIDRYNTLDVEQKDDILDTICDLIDKFDIANIKELRRFINAQGSAYGVPNMKIVNHVIRSHTGLIRLYFDGSFQERLKDRDIEPKVDFETGEILEEK